MMTVLLLPIFMSLLAVSSINVALPSLQAGLGASDTQIQWALSGYTLVFGMVLVPAGRAGDLFGRRRLVVLGLCVFALGSLLSGLAPTGTLLDLARVVMGVGAGLFNPQVTGFIQGEFEGRQRARAFGALGSTVGVSAAAGPLLGGGLIALLGPDVGSRAGFLVNVPIALAAAVLALRRLPREATARRGRVDLDPAGVVLLAAGLLALMLPFLDRGLGPQRFLLIPVSVVLLAGWVLWERRHQRRGGDPMVDLRLFRSRGYALGALLIGVYSTGVTSTFVVVAMYMQNGLGYPALQAALIGLPSALLASVMANVAGRVVLRAGRWIEVLGMSLVLLALLLTMAVMWGHLQHGLSPWWMLATLGLSGAGQGMVVSPHQTLSLAQVPREQAGTAGGVLQTGQRVGTAVGSAVIVGVYFGVQAVSGWDAGFLVAFACIGVAVLLGLAVAVLDLVLGRRERARERAGAATS